MKVFDLYRDKSLSVIVPVYNEEKNIKQNISVLENELKQYFDHYEIIVVSDGSADKTYEEALKYRSDKVRILHYPNNQGKGFALKYGFGQSHGDYVIFIDGGMELHPKDIKIFLGLMEIYDVDAVIGSKRHPQSKINYPLSRRILSRIYQLFIRKFLNVNVKDTQVGLKLFKRKVLEDVLPRVVVKRYAFDLEVFTVASHLGYKNILEAPIELDFRVSKRGFFPDLAHTLKVGWPLLWDTLAIVYRLKILKYYDRKTEE